MLINTKLQYWVMLHAFLPAVFPSKNAIRVSNSFDPNHVPQSAQNHCSLRCERLLHPWKITGPELKCLQRLSVEKTLASKDKILHFMAFDIISLILSRVCLASICQFLFHTIFE